MKMSEQELLDELRGHVEDLKDDLLRVWVWCNIAMGITFAVAVSALAKAAGWVSW